MNTSSRGIEFIKRWEGLRLEAYPDTKGKLTIGYGSTRDVTAGMKITEEQAGIRLLGDLVEAEAGVNDLVEVPLTQGRFDALVSFVFNLGYGKVSDATLWKKLNALDPTAPAEFPKWCHDGEKVSPGLLNRRIEELAMFLAG